jgi:signal-transduction protein with cAMP-binding, CBS, and nucleotidyltransferase domain
MNDLRKHSLFAELTDDELFEFLPHLYLRAYNKDEVVYFRNDPSQAFYMIKTGVVELNLDIEDKFETIVNLEAGRFFGENSMMPETRRMYNAISRSSKTNLLILPQVNLLEIFADNASIKAKVHSALSKHYYKMLSGFIQNYRNSFAFFDLRIAIEKWN